MGLEWREDQQCDCSSKLLCAMDLVLEAALQKVGKSKISVRFVIQLIPAVSTGQEEPLPL